MKKTCLILGNGIAGVTAAQVLRQKAPDMELILAGDEPHIPYKRTKISKTLVSGSDENYELFPSSWYDEQSIQLLKGYRAVELNTTEKTVTFASGMVLTYDFLLLATGAEAHTPAPGQRALRTQADKEDLLQRMSQEGVLEIMGDGILAVEIADEALKYGKEVRILSRRGLPLHKELPPEMCLEIRKVLEMHGVEFLPLSDDAGPLACIGSHPRMDLAKRAGIVCRQGVVVNALFQTSASNVWAAGDCCEFPDGSVGHLWHEAEESGRRAALSILDQGDTSPFPPYRLKLDLRGRFYFSMKPRDAEANPHYVKEDLRTDHGRYIFYLLKRTVRGLVYQGPKDLSKGLEKAVQEGWNLDRVLEFFPL